MGRRPKISCECPAGLSARGAAQFADLLRRAFSNSSKDWHLLGIRSAGSSTENRRVLRA
jgi:hypothetical protein